MTIAVYIAIGMVVGVGLGWIAFMWLLGRWIDGQLKK